MKKLLLSLGLFVSLSACSSKSDSAATIENRKFLNTQLAPAALMAHTENFLSWNYGYDIQIRDRSRGIMVTKWVNNNITARHRLSLRINQGVDGAMLTAHYEEQELNNGQWKDKLSNGFFESKFIDELETNLKQNAAQQKSTQK